VKSQQRNETVQQRVLLRMLVCAAELETQGFDDVTATASSDVDPDWLAAKRTHTVSEPKKKKVHYSSSTREDLTLSLMAEFPDLLSLFKSDVFILRSLSELPEYFGKFLSFPSCVRIEVSYPIPFSF
jgi:hypothetical protein